LNAEGSRGSSPPKKPAAIADLSLTKVVDGDLLKVLAWYDNEWGFTNQMIRQILAL